MKTNGRLIKKQKPALYIRIFILIEIILFLLFMSLYMISAFSNPLQNSYYMTITGTGILTPSYLKYYSIILCLGISILKCYKGGNRAVYILAAAMFFTAVSDYFLLLHPGNIIPGLISFCLVHTIYLYVIANGNLKLTFITASLRILAAVTIGLILKFTGILKFGNDQNMTPLVILVILYGISFVSNIFKLAITVLDKTKKDKECLFPNPYMFLMGLALFILCDFNVLIYNLDSFFNIGSSLFETIKNFSSVLMWGFYLPSQVIIVLSVVA